MVGAATSNEGEDDTDNPIATLDGRRILGIHVQDDQGNRTYQTTSPTEPLPPSPSHLSEWASHPCCPHLKYALVLAPPVT